MRQDVANSSPLIASDAHPVLSWGPKSLPTARHIICRIYTQESSKRSRAFRSQKWRVVWRIHSQKFGTTNCWEYLSRPRLSSEHSRAPKASHIKPVGRMSILREFDVPGVVPGCFLGRPFCASKQELRAPGSELLGQSLGIPRTEKWPKPGHAHDWIYYDWA